MSHIGALPRTSGEGRRSRLAWVKANRCSRQHRGCHAQARAVPEDKRLDVEEFVESQELRTKLLWTLGQFEGRRFDEALIAEMTDVLNSELAPWRDGQRIRLSWDDARVGLEIELAEEGPENDGHPCLSGQPSHGRIL
jgi:hypothetical protein